VQDFNRRKTFQSKFRIELAKRFEHPGVIAERKRWMQPADDVQLSDPQLKSFARFLDNFFHTKLKAIRIPLLSSERAELAAQNAIIGIIDVAINDVARAIADFSLPREIGNGSNSVQVLAFEKPQRIALRNALACGNLFVKIPQFAALDKELHEI
jgi:hypothetical protein